MTEGAAERVDVAIVGAGFAGLCALHRMNAMGMSAVAIEAGGGVGGTWYWNAYPGARCDVASFEYSFSFDDALQQDWHWSERYAGQPEILRYLQHVAERYDLLPQIRLNTRVEAAQWRESDRVWYVSTSAGTLEARFLLMATGVLSRPNIPAIEGMNDFAGPLFHSGRWPHDGIDLAGKRVGVIGTGSSGVQIVGNIAADVADLHVFQRTPHWVVPAGNRPTGSQEERNIKQRYAALRERLADSLLGMDVESGGGAALDASGEERRQRYEQRWQEGGPGFLMSFDDLLVNPESNATACAFVADKIRSIVRDAVTAEKLIPDTARYPIGARRLVMSDKYYDCFNRPNVHLVDTRSDPVAAITKDGIRQRSGDETGLDLIVLATGFDAMTGALLDIDITGRDGISLRDKWSAGPRTYLGLVTEGLPNLFIITGPGSPSVFSNVVVSIEQHIDFLSDLIGWMDEREIATFEAEAGCERKWGEKVLAFAKLTVLMNVDSWYWGANVDGKPKAFLPYLGGVGTYRDECSKVAAAGYAGFIFD